MSPYNDMKISNKFFRSSPPRVAVVAFFWFVACASEQPTSLYKDIKTGVVAVKSTSYDRPGYVPVPDSLRLRFDKILRALRVVVKAAGCDSLPQATVEESAGRLTVLLDMQNGCVPVREEFFDVDMLISPVHEDEFRLLVISYDPGLVLLDQLVDVRKLPPLK
jgi:hypothetical protein